MLQRLDLLADCAQVLVTQLFKEVNAAMPGTARNHFWQNLWLGQRKFLHSSRHPSQRAAVVLFASARALASVCLLTFSSQVSLRPELFIEGRGPKGTYRERLIFLLVWVNALALREGHPVRAAGHARTASLLLRARPWRTLFRLRRLRRWPARALGDGSGRILLHRRMVLVKKLVLLVRRPHGLNELGTDRLALIQHLQNPVQEGRGSARRRPAGRRVSAQSSAIVALPRAPGQPARGRRRADQIARADARSGQRAYLRWISASFS